MRYYCKNCGSESWKEEIQLSRRSHDKLYRTWCNMRNRCNNPKASDYKYYGGKGIKICEEWSTYEVFYQWAKNNGYNNDLTIDRIDSNGDYCPRNCRWISFFENDSRAHKGQNITLEQRRNISKKLKLYFQTNINPNCKKVRCIETGAIYNSVKEASLSLGLNKYAVGCAISHKVRCGGYRWEYVKMEA